MFNVGDKVFSKSFGEGIVIGVGDINFDYPVDVQFDTLRSFTIDGHWNNRKNEDEMIQLIPTPTPVPTQIFKVGDKVISNYYGKGVVLKTDDGCSENYPIRVEFDRIDEDNGDEDGIQFFNKEGYYDCDKLEDDMIKLIPTPVQTNQEVVADTSMHDKNQTNHMLRALSDNNRKFKIKYRDIQQYINRDDLRDCKVKTITGTIENFNPNAEVVIQGEDGEFCIIMYRQILQMEEII